MGRTQQMDGVLELLKDPWFVQGSYFAVFGLLVLTGFGLPLPEEVIFLAAGLLAAQAGGSVWWMIVAGVLGIFCGDSVIFFAGRKYGSKLLRRRPFSSLIKERNLERMRSFFKKYGAFTVFIARFIAGGRAPAFFLSASMGVKYRLFLFWDGLGTLISCPLSIWLAYTYGEDVFELLHKYKGTFFLGLAAVVLIFILLAVRRNRRRGEESSVPGVLAATAEKTDPGGEDDGTGNTPPPDAANPA